MHRFLVLGATLAVALALSGSAAAWSWPADGQVLRAFELGSDPYAAGQHRGIDVAGAAGSPVRAPAAGTVTFAGSVPTHGRGVTILTADGYSVTLFHLASVEVVKGDMVDEGGPVGTMGSSGEPEHGVPSVHLGIRAADRQDGYVDPIGLLPARPAQPASPPPAAASAPVAVPTPASTPTAPPPPVVQPPVPSSATPAQPATAPAVPEPATPVAPTVTASAPAVAAPAAPPEPVRASVPESAPSGADAGSGSAAVGEPTRVAFGDGTLHGAPRSVGEGRSEPAIASREHIGRAPTGGGRTVPSVTDVRPQAVAEAVGRPSRVRSPRAAVADSAPGVRADRANLALRPGRRHRSAPISPVVRDERELHPGAARPCARDGADQGGGCGLREAAPGARGARARSGPSSRVRRGSGPRDRPRARRAARRPHPGGPGSGTDRDEGRP